MYFSSTTLQNTMALPNKAKDVQVSTTNNYTIRNSIKGMHKNVHGCTVYSSPRGGWGWERRLSTYSRMNKL